MTRAAFLPFPGDPFLLHYWLKLFKDTWIDEVDRLYIAHNSSIEPEVAEYIEDLARRVVGDKLTFLYTPRQTDHGLAINQMLDACQEDHVMLIEDDGFIFKKGVVDQLFLQLESGNFDVIGSKRGSCSLEILEAAKKKWDLDYSGYGDQGCNFWPCFFFTSRDLLIKTDRNFCAKGWKQGEMIDSIDYEVRPDVVVGDTFVNTSLQIRNMVPKNRIRCIPQWHGSPNDLEDFEKRVDLFSGNAFWCHIGSLSSGIGGVLCDDFGHSLSRRDGEPAYVHALLPDCCSTDNEKKEWERRIQWWLTFWENREVGKIDYFAAEYRKAIDRVIVQYGLSIKNIRRRQKAYKAIGL